MRRLIALGFSLLACATRPHADPVPTPVRRGVNPSFQCADRGAPVEHDADAARTAAGASRAGSDVVVTTHAVVFRDERGHLARRALGDGATLPTVDAPGALVYADDQRALLWQREPDLRRLARVTFVGRRTTRSDPAPLPPWALASTELEAADSVEAWPEGDAAVVRWTAYTSWRGGYPPSAQEAARSHHEDCGSLRVDAAGHIVAGGSLPAESMTAPPSPVAPRSYLQQRYAGEGTWWLNDIDPRTNAVTHLLVDAAGRRIEARLPPSPEGLYVDVAGVWAAGDRVVVQRVLRAGEGFLHARDLVTLDRSTGATVWTARMSPLQIVPPRP